ncbi:hypothetical protein C0J52_24132 [Blattella germanica]|nr:hypothetical protein C0J52_24132 [Blattella germanica]
MRLVTFTPTVNGLQLQIDTRRALIIFSGEHMEFLLQTIYHDVQCELHYGLRVKDARIRFQSTIYELKGHWVDLHQILFENVVEQQLQLDEHDNQEHRTLACLLYQTYSHFQQCAMINYPFIEFSMFSTTYFHAVIENNIRPVKIVLYYFNRGPPGRNGMLRYSPVMPGKSTKGTKSKKENCYAKWRQKPNRGRELKSQKDSECLYCKGLYCTSNEDILHTKDEFRRPICAFVRMRRQQMQFVSRIHCLSCKIECEVFWNSGDTEFSSMPPVITEEASNVSLCSSTVTTYPPPVTLSPTRGQVVTRCRLPGYGEMNYWDIRLGGKATLPQMLKEAVGGGHKKQEKESPWQPLSLHNIIVPLMHCRLANKLASLPWHPVVSSFSSKLKTSISVNRVLITDGAYGTAQTMVGCFGKGRRLFGQQQQAHPHHHSNNILLFSNQSPRAAICYIPKRTTSAFLVMELFIHLSLMLFICFILCQTFPICHLFAFPNFVSLRQCRNTFYVGYIRSTRTYIQQFSEDIDFVRQKYFKCVLINTLRIGIPDVCSFSIFLRYSKNECSTSTNECGSNIALQLFRDVTFPMSLSTASNQLKLVVNGCSAAGEEGLAVPTVGLVSSTPLHQKSASPEEEESWSSSDSRGAANADVNSGMKVHLSKGNNIEPNRTHSGSISNVLWPVPPEQCLIKGVTAAPGGPGSKNNDPTISCESDKMEFKDLDSMKVFPSTSIHYINK